MFSWVGILRPALFFTLHLKKRKNQAAIWTDLSVYDSNKRRPSADYCIKRCDADTDRQLLQLLCCLLL